MASIRSRDTNPEIVIRRALHARGFRYRTNVKGMPGKPDIVLSRYRAVIFVHGCFWHAHDCAIFRLPSTRRDFWQEKLRQNRERDEKVWKALAAADWRVLTVWECAIRGPEKLAIEVVIDEIADWLEEGGDSLEIRGAAIPIV